MVVNVVSMIKTYGPNRCKTNHSEACRSRIESELAKSPEGQVRIERARARFDAATWQAGGGEAQDSVAVPQGEMDDVIDAALAADEVVPSNDDVPDVPVSFMPMPDDDSRSLRETIDAKYGEGI